MQSESRLCPIGDQAHPQNRARPLGASAYPLTVLLSAFLLFELQPIIGRMVLPWFGGSAAVWTICMLFFQALLLLGYLYAHTVVIWFSANAQRWIHLSLIGVSVTMLPLAAGVHWKPVDGGDPT
jgi:hypothetical protein